jgi:hypothetical protein
MKLLICIIFLVITFNSYSKDNFQNMSYYELINYKFDDNMNINKHTFLEKITDKKDNCVLLGINIIMGSLCYIQYNSMSPQFKIEHKQQMFKTFILYDMILNVSTITIRFI